MVKNCKIIQIKNSQPPKIPKMRQTLKVTQIPTHVHPQLNNNDNNAIERREMNMKNKVSAFHGKNTRQ
jgi:hypothetical protein